MEYITRSSIALVTIVTVLTMFLTLCGGGQATLAQQNTSENNSSEKAGMSNMTNMTAVGPGGTPPSMSTPGEKTFYIFTSR